MEALLQGAKAGLAVLVKANDFAVYDRRPSQTVPQCLHNVGELKVLRDLISTEQRQLSSVKASEDAQAVALLLRIGAARSCEDLETNLRALAIYIADLSLRPGGRGAMRGATAKLLLTPAEDLAEDRPPRRTFLRL